MPTPDDEIEPEYRQMMQDLAHRLDWVFNPDAFTDGGMRLPAVERKTGFFLLVFPFGEEAKGKANYISNGGDRKGIATLMREMAARFEGQPEMKGRG